LFSNAINKQATNGQKDDQLRDLQNIAVFVHEQLPIFNVLIHQVAALWHDKN